MDQGQQPSTHCHKREVCRLPNGDRSHDAQGWQLLRAVRPQQEDIGTVRKGGNPLLCQANPINTHLETRPVPRLNTAPAKL